MMMKYVQVNFKIGGATQQMKYKNDKFLNKWNQND